METETLNMIVVGATAIAATIPPAIFGWIAFTREAKAKRQEAKLEYERTHERLLFESKLRVAEAAIVSLVRVIDIYHNMILCLDNMGNDLTDAQSIAVGEAFDAYFAEVQKLSTDFENGDRALLGLYFQFQMPEYLRFQSKHELTAIQLEMSKITEEFTAWNELAESTSPIPEKMLENLDDLQNRWKKGVEKYKEVTIKVFVGLNQVCNLIKVELRSDKLPSTNSIANWPNSNSPISKP